MPGAAIVVKKKKISIVKKPDLHKQEDFLWLDKDCMETQAAVICQQTS